MKKVIPFMTDDELMELLAENMNVYFEDYEEIMDESDKIYTRDIFARD